MFDALTENLSSVFDRLRGRGALSERDVETALGDIRKALLEADVALPVVGAFIDRVRPRAIGTEVLKSVTPGQQVVKVVNDELVDMLGAAEPLALDAVPPVGIMMVGLQGSVKPPAPPSCRMPSRRRQTQSADGLAGHATSGGDGTACRVGSPD